MNITVWRFSFGSLDPIPALWINESYVALPNGVRHRIDAPLTAYRATRDEAIAAGVALYGERIAALRRSVEYAESEASEFERKYVG